MTKIFVPLDVETTGLNPNGDFILEIAWMTVDESLVPLTEPRSFIIDHGELWGEVWAALREAPQAVRDMHAASGLTGDLLAKPAYSMESVLRALHDDIREAKLEFGVATTVHLLGRSVHFDKSFLEAEQEAQDTGLFDPRSYTGIHHRLFDLSAISMMLEVSGYTLPVVENERPHRALNDVLEAVEYAGAIRNLIGVNL